MNFDSTRLITVEIHQLLLGFTQRNKSMNMCTKYDGQPGTKIESRRYHIIKMLSIAYLIYVF